MILDIVFVLVGVFYLVISALLFAFGSNLMALSTTVLRHGRDAGPVATTSAPLPLVTVQLPIYNELYVAKRVIDAACRLDYPNHLLQIQVLDDSNDETREIVAAVVAGHRATGLDIVHLHRADRTGYKAGALANGLQTATGEFVAIFDADFVPPPDYLRRVVPCFSDEGVAFVQARWGHLNRDSSWLTRLQALAIDGHFMVEQAGRGIRDYWFNFNGTAGTWRVTAIADAGGWTSDTLTEDLDLSYRAHLRGWRGAYLRDVVVPGELPVQLSGFRRQQHRWARGSIECAIKLLPGVWRAPVSPMVRFQATAHLAGYGVQLLLFALTLIYPLVVLGSERFPGLTTLFGLSYLFSFASLAPAMFFVVAQHQQRRPWWRHLLGIVGVTAIGSGFMLNTVRATADIWRRPDPEFERTAKFGIEAPTTQWTRRRYQGRLDRIVWAELALGAYSLWSSSLAVRHGNWGVATFATMFGVGLVVVAVASIGQALAVHAAREQRAAEAFRESVAA